MKQDDTPGYVQKESLGIKVEQGFGDYLAHFQNPIIIESNCLLKTKTDRYKEHFALVTGNELYCYRNKEDIERGEPHRVMHSLIGTFVKEIPTENSMSEKCTLYPVKIVIPPNKSRLLFFKEEAIQKMWINRLKSVVGHSNMFDYYNLEDDLGKG